VSARLIEGDCLAAMRGMAERGERVHAVVTDPPYHLTSIVKRFGGDDAAPAQPGSDGLFARASAGFMGKKWDGGDIAFQPETWRLAYDLLPPGGHLAAFGGTRTFHRMAVAIEDAGFEIRDVMSWNYGTGFPKSHNLDGDWKGWGTALKPGYEPILLGQKPYTPQEFLAILVPTVGDLLCRVVSLAKTDTCLSDLLRTSGFLSTAWSLNSILAALYGHENKCTTETAFALTTDLRTLKSSLSKIIPAITTPGPTPASGAVSAAWLAAATSESALAKCERLACTTAGEIAIDWRALEGSAPGGGDFATAWEPIILARKPLAGTVAANVLTHGVGAINVDGCRIGTEGGSTTPSGMDRLNAANAAQGYRPGIYERGAPPPPTPAGRWPANVLHDGSDEVEAAFAAFGEKTSGTGAVKRATGAGYSPNALGRESRPAGTPNIEYGDTGSASRFFYSAKATAADRAGSKHPTVKPVALMRWLVRLVCPPGGVVLDPFAGSGTTGAAAVAEGMGAVLIEAEAEYQADIRHRLGLPSVAAAGLL
jgi:DNA modification methylase